MVRRAKKTVFDDQYKKNAVKLVEKLGSQKLAAAELGVSEVNIHNWVKKFGGKPRRKLKTAVATNPISRPEGNELESLRLENQELREKIKTLRHLVAVLSQDYLKET